MFYISRNLESQMHLVSKSECFSNLLFSSPVSLVFKNTLNLCLCHNLKVVDFSPQNCLSWYYFLFYLQTQTHIFIVVLRISFFTMWRFCFVFSKHYFVPSVTLKRCRWSHRSFLIQINYTCLRLICVYIFLFSSQKLFFLSLSLKFLQIFSLIRSDYFRSVEYFLYLLFTIKARWRANGFCLIQSGFSFDEAEWRFHFCSSFRLKRMLRWRRRCWR